MRTSLAVQIAHLQTYSLSAPRLMWGLSCRITFSKELWTFMSPLYSTKLQVIVGGGLAFALGLWLGKIGDA
jgi:ABC-type nitrate/sulfonate/bicarbonate transport system permease component